MPFSVETVVNEDGPFERVKSSSQASLPSNWTHLVHGLSKAYLPPQNTGSYTILKRRPSREDHVSELTEFDLTSQRYLCLTYSKNGAQIFLPVTVAQYCVLFCLGTLARYYPAIWGRILTKDPHGETFLLERTLGIIRRKFPNLVLNLVHSDSFFFFSERTQRTDTRTFLTQAEVDDSIDNALKFHISRMHS